jgi:hypothetical protein
MANIRQSRARYKPFKPFRLFPFRMEVNVAGGVDDVDVVVLPPREPVWGSRDNRLRALLRETTVYEPI